MPYIFCSNTPQQNGVAERKDEQGTDEKSEERSSGAGLAQAYWAEAVGTARYLKNRSPTSALVDKTPHEVSRKKPSVAHLRVFGCNAFVHLPKEKRSI